jgi:hypothetical protein
MLLWWLFHCLSALHARTRLSGALCGVLVLGNYLSPDVFPTISQTLLVPSGRYALHGFFGGFPSVYSNFEAVNVTALDAILNLIILMGIPVLVLLLTNQVLRRQARRL